MTAEIPDTENTGAEMPEGEALQSAAAARDAWRRVLVYGLGLSGRSAAELLRARGVAVLAVDQRDAAELELGELASDPGMRLLQDGEPDSLPEDLHWQGIDAVVVSPGVPPGRPLLEAARAAGKPVIAEVELAFPWLSGPLVGITGSNGKSTTTTLTGAMLEAAGFHARVCGNIGEPLTAQVERGRAEGSPDAQSADPPGEAGDDGTPIYVAELSSFQLEAVDLFHPKAAALLNISADHLDRHADLQAYRAAKLALFRRQSPGDVAVLNADDPLVAEVAGTLRARRRWFSRRGPVADGCWVDAGQVLERSPLDTVPRPLFAASDMRLAGHHNLENAMAAALLARASGASTEAIVRALREFRGLPHRLEAVREHNGVVFFDDSKGTNPAATAKSLEGFEDGKVHLILGGQFKGGDLGELARAVARKVRRAYLIGESAEIFERRLRAQPGMTAELERAGTLATAVRRAAENARPGEAVVLSPACASFDQFTSFAERGHAFQQLVQDLTRTRAGDSEEADHGA
ncbi:MAG: UDP-N-acetylmuramoyl-L-alanine--D-glutamate ligase [Holophagales bacterium]|nr:UDP-N-acetylmuramoyl-L-alanine--D-glutamate ligase [Holophagales bacterium]